MESGNEIGARESRALDLAAERHRLIRCSDTTSEMYLALTWVNDMMRRNLEVSHLVLHRFRVGCAPVTAKAKNVTTKVILFTAMMAVAMAFVRKYVIRYYLR